MYHDLVSLSALLVLINTQPNTTLSQYEPLLYAILAIVMMFYPLSGFIADVCCGRLKIVVISLVCLSICWILLLLVIGLMISIVVFISSWDIII